jgi:hypothetical protein
VCSLLDTCKSQYLPYFFYLLAGKPNLEKNYIYSSKFLHNSHLSESSFTCPVLRASGLAQRLTSSFGMLFVDWLIGNMTPVNLEIYFFLKIQQASNFLLDCP